ncbi:ParB N-terminal domain-containing protein [Umezawaea sp. Da 62-37]|uniref:ParB N-terminal domain-containing protein n=1 Tax=Umezawaea sp. Da 62-37 TaxID=3075927 RepID=UPI0028F6E477|nr:ParB N-terminal domain-containing protein [Umezawaea sp. Da 62-37]WNV90389.1 ParB N-terminal domain-containing protein [Umezawaea sp. Da 62-37]
MNGFSGDPDALIAMAAVLTVHRTRLVEAQQDLLVRDGQLRLVVANAVARCVADHAAAAEALRAVDPRDEDALAAARQRLSDEAARLNQARAQQRILVRVLDDAKRAVGARSRVAITSCDRGIARLRQVWQEVERAGRAFAAVLGNWIGGGTSAPLGHHPAGGGSGAASAAPVADTWAAPGGQVLVPLSEIDGVDDVVSGPLDFGKVSLADMRAGLTRLESVVLPAVRAGAGREEMRSLDEARNLTGDIGSHLRIFEAFFGDSCLKLVRENGRYTVIGGNHRIWAARRLGFDELPALVRERR